MPRHLAQDSGAGIRGPVNGVTKAHDQLTRGQALVDRGLGVAPVANLQQHLQCGRVGAAVQGSLEGSYCTGDRRMQVGQGRGYHAPGESGCIEFVLGVQDQGNVKAAGCDGGGSLPPQLI